MIKNLHHLGDFCMHYIKNRSTSKALGIALMLYGGSLYAQYKIDPKFENVISIQKKGNLNSKNFKKIIEENQLSTSTVVLPNGNTEELFQAIVYGDYKKFENKGYLIQATTKTFFTALLSLDQIQELGNNENIKSIEVPKIDGLNNIPHVTESGTSLLHSGVLNNQSYKGQGVLVGIFDTGIDFKHPDFNNLSDPTKTRILRIWDQTLTPETTTEKSPTGFSYGVEYTKAEIDDEIDGSPTNLVRTVDTNGHGTHVAGTAVGSGLATVKRLFTGTAPEADIIVVRGGVNNFSSFNQTNGLEYFKKVAEELNRPIVVNMSIGGQVSTHDGTEVNEIAVNEFSKSGPGRVVVISAGNDGGGKIHHYLNLNPGEKKSFTINTEDPPTGVTNNSLDFFSFITYNRGLENNLDVTLRITAPNGEIVTRPPESFATDDIKDTSGNTILTIQSANYWELERKKRWTQTVVKRTSTSVPIAGTYVFEFENTNDVPLELDGWITSYSVNLNPIDGNNDYTTGSPGNADEAITVANHAASLFVLNKLTANYSYLYSTFQDKNFSSSIGPRVDGFRKPEISADGTLVTSALSSNIPSYTTAGSIIDGKYYRAISGTSMAAPGVAGSVALLLQANPNLTAKQVKDRLTSTTTKDKFTTENYSTTFGYGKINTYNSVLQEVNSQNNNQSCPVGNFTILGYDTYDKSYSSTDLPNSYQANIANTQKVALKYTPTISGKLKSVYMLMGYNNPVTDSPFTVEVRKANVDGLPGDLIATKTFDSTINTNWYGWNNLDISDLNVDAIANKDIFINFYTTGTHFRIFYDKDNIDGRTYISNNDGAYIQNKTLDPKIRIVIHENTAAVHQLATADSTTKQQIIPGYNLAINNCKVVTRIESEGAIPVTGEITSKIWVDNYTNELVSRRIQVENSTQNPTGKITLFFTQAEFDAFNNGKTTQLPTDKSTNLENVRVYFYAGTSSDNSGKHLSYNVKSLPIAVNPQNVKWNDTYKYWEVTVDYAGQGGYFVGTENSLSNVDLSLNNIQIYPNPVTDHVNISLPNQIKDASIKLIDLTGKVIISQNIKGAINKINIPNIPQGVYVLELKTSEGTINKKIIKK